MAYEVKSPKYGLLNWRLSPDQDVAPDPTPQCQEDYPFCFPIVNPEDLKFQFRILFDSYAAAFDYATANGAVAQLVMLSGTGNTYVTAGPNTIRNYYTADGLEFKKTITGDKEVTLYWPHGLPNIADIALDACFQLGVIIVLEDNTQGIHHIANECFKRKQTICDTSLLEVDCSDDAYDFRYCQFGALEPPVVPTNAIRVPMLLQKPQNPKERGMYRKSNGALKRTFSVTAQTWEGLVDYLPYFMHRALSLWLDHDRVKITSDIFTGYVVLSGDYTADWTDESRWIAQAGFKVEETPFDARRTECANCADCPELVNFEHDRTEYNYLNNTQTFYFTYGTSGTVFSQISLQYKLSSGTDWTAVTVDNSSPISINLPLGIYDFRAIPIVSNCLPLFTTVIEGEGYDTAPACPKVSGVTVVYLTDDPAGRWLVQNPVPAFGYTWQLLLDGDVIASGNLLASPPTYPYIPLTGLESGKDYVFQVRANCTEDNHSDWEVYNFTTP